MIIIQESLFVYFGRGCGKGRGEGNTFNESAWSAIKSGHIDFFLRNKKKMIFFSKEL
jgi:hypothetical protein